MFGLQSWLLNKYFSHNTLKIQTIPRNQLAGAGCSDHLDRLDSNQRPRCAATRLKEVEGLRHVCFKFILRWKCRTPICFGSLKIEPRFRGKKFCHGKFHSKCTAIKSERTPARLPRETSLPRRAGERRRKKNIQTSISLSAARLQMEEGNVS